MSPPAAAAPGKTATVAFLGSTIRTSGQLSTSTLTSTSTSGTSVAGDGINNEEDSVEAAKPGEMMSFEIEAGDGLTEADAADLTSILRKVSKKATEKKYRSSYARLETKKMGHCIRNSHRTGGSAESHNKA